MRELVVVSLAIDAPSLHSAISARHGNQGNLPRMLFDAIDLGATFVFAISGAPISANRPANSGSVSSVPIRNSSCSSISPVSIPASIRIVVFPVTVSPLAIAH